MVGCGREEQFRSVDSAAAAPKPSAVTANESQIGDRVAVSAGQATVGFVGNELTQAVALQAFRISKYPVTRAQFDACVNAGACKPSGSCTADTGQNASPQQAFRCADLAGTKAYCAWVGGTLPTLDQWLVAARGPDVSPYPWGSTPPSCAQYAPDDSEDCVSATDKKGVVGEHPSGASPSGMQDALLTRTELVAGTPRAPFLVCEGQGSTCLVQSQVDGGLRGVGPVAEGATSIGQYGFRCAWGSK